MSGYYGRKSYDKSEESKSRRLSTAYGDYSLTNFIPNQCYVPATVIGGRVKQQKTGQLIELESNLKRLDIHGGKYSNDRIYYNSKQKAKSLHESLQKPIGECSNLKQSYSRMNRSSVDVRTGYGSRFDFPIVDPRESVFNGFSNQEGDLRFGIDTRAQAKFGDQDEYYNKILDKKL